jgi:hypothetical protein
MHETCRNYRSDRGPTLSLRPISGSDGDCDVKWIAGYRDGPFGTRASVQQSHALDRHRGSQAGHRGLALGPRDTPIWKLEAALKCQSFKKRRYAPPVHMINLTQEREITPYVWVHPDDDDRR